MKYFTPERYKRLQATGNFVIFDTQECKLLFDESE